LFTQERDGTIVDPLESHNNIMMLTRQSSLSTSEHLKKHQQRPTGKKPHCCSDGGKDCKFSSELKIHQRVHTGEKPYCCSDCGKLFSGSNSLKVHLRIHWREISLLL
jgi:uncharacterized Zn-finger protein